MSRQKKRPRSDAESTNKKCTDELKKHEEEEEAARPKLVTVMMRDGMCSMSKNKEGNSDLYPSYGNNTIAKLRRDLDISTQRLSRYRMKSAEFQARNQSLQEENRALRDLVKEIQQQQQQQQQQEESLGHHHNERVDSTITETEVSYSAGFDITDNVQNLASDLNSKLCEVISLQITQQNEINTLRNEINSDKKELSLMSLRDTCIIDKNKELHVELNKLKERMKKVEQQLQHLQQLQSCDDPKKNKKERLFDDEMSKMKADYEKRFTDMQTEINKLQDSKMTTDDEEGQKEKEREKEREKHLHLLALNNKKECFDQMNEMRAEFERMFLDMKKDIILCNNNHTRQPYSSSVSERSNATYSRRSSKSSLRRGKVPKLVTINNNDNSVNHEKEEKENIIHKTNELSLHDGYISDLLIHDTGGEGKGMVVVHASKDKSIKITRLSDKKLVKEIKNAHVNCITSLVMTKMIEDDDNDKDKDGLVSSPSSPFYYDVIASSGSSTVKFWRIDTNYEEVGWNIQCGSHVRSLAAYEEQVQGMESIGGGRVRHMLACGTDASMIELWDVQSKRMVNVLRDHVHPVHVLHTFEYETKTFLLSGDVTKKLNLWCLEGDDKNNKNNNKLVKTLHEEEGAIGSITTFESSSSSSSNDKEEEDTFIAAGVSEGKVRIYRMSKLLLPTSTEQENDNDEEEEIEIACHFDTIRSMKPFKCNILHNNGEKENKKKVMLATVSYNGYFDIVDIQKKKVVHEIKCDETHRFWSLDCDDRNDDGNVVFLLGGQNKETKKGDLVFLNMNC